jgi:Holliday junction resolvase
MSTNEWGDCSWDDCDVENILASKKRKSLNSGAKGKRKERELVKVFSGRFGPGFSRTVGSGNRWGQVSDLPEHAKETYTGDILRPAGFQWVIECKGGYNDIDLNNAFDGGITQLNEFLAQVHEEAVRSGQKPLLCWKKDRRPWLSFLRPQDVPHDHFFPYRLDYLESSTHKERGLEHRSWVAVSLTELLTLPDDFFLVK